MDQTIDQLGFLFVGGAPRSGTTLLLNILREQEGILSFPAEHSTLERYHWNLENIESYARNEFINDRREGQQTLLANTSYKLKKQAQLRAEYGKNFEIEVDCEKFKAAYLSYLENRPASLSNILNALSHAQIAATSVEKLAQIRWKTFKQPFFTEFYARRVSQLIPEAKFIHILRDPKARYVSAKTRRLAQAKMDKNKLGPINRISYVQGHALIDVATHQLAKKNQAELGASNYRIIHFNDLVTDSQGTLESIMDWLKLDKNVQLMTEQNRKLSAGSSLISNAGVDSTASDRSKQYLELTSWNERRIHNWLLEKYLQNNAKGALPLLTAFLTPLRGSNLRNYVCQLLDLLSCFQNRSSEPLEEFLAKVEQGTAEVSGAT